MTLFQEGLANYLEWYVEQFQDRWKDQKSYIDQVKGLEFTLQEAIEGIYPDRCWFQTTKVKIFEELLGNVSIIRICDLIAVDILKERKTDE